MKLSRDGHTIDLENKVTLVGQLGFIHTIRDQNDHDQIRKPPSGLITNQNTTSRHEKNTKKTKFKGRQPSASRTLVDEETGLPLEEVAALAEVDIHQQISLIYFSQILMAFCN